MAIIGIIGAGIAGLHLGLFLQHHGIPATLYADRTPEQIRGGRLPNNPIRFGHTRARDQALGVDHWTGRGADVRALHFAVSGEQPLAFRGRLSRPGAYVDPRIYQAALLEDFAARGGAVVFGTVQAEDLERLGTRHDLLVVASGRGSLVERFPCVAEHSPYDRPQRQLCLGFFQGITLADPESVTFVIAPGQGEIFLTNTFSFDGNQPALLFEAIPGSTFEPLAHMRPEDDPRRFETAVLAVLQVYAPTIYAQVDPRAFRLTRPLDLLQGAIVPTVRRGYTRLDNGTYAIAIGDVHVVNDPVSGQGANIASHSAWTLGETILESFSPDEQFCQRAAERIWAYVRPVTELSNFMLQPPPPHMRALLGAAARSPAIADAFADGFDAPDHTWELLRSPERVAAFLDTAGAYA